MLVYRVLQQAKTLDPKVTMYLLSKMEPTLYNYRMSNLGDTVLRMLIGRGSDMQFSQDWYNIIEFLIHEGADVSIKNYSGETALDKAREVLKDVDKFPEKYSNRAVLDKVIALLELTEKNRINKKQ